MVQILAFLLNTGATQRQRQDPEVIQASLSFYPYAVLHSLTLVSLLN